jgi:hypothetical protein
MSPLLRALALCLALLLAVGADACVPAGKIRDCKGTDPSKRCCPKLECSFSSLGSGYYCL